MHDEIARLVAERPDMFAVQPAHEGQQAVCIANNIWSSAGTSNAYMVLTSAGRVIINTGMGFEALVHKAQFDKVYNDLTPYIILTQGHVDHVGGVEHFRSAGTRVIAQKNNAACQNDDQRIQKLRASQSYIWFQSTIDSAIQAARKNPEIFLQAKPVPDILFDDVYRFNCGDVEFEIFATPGGETLDSCVVWLPAQKTLFSGNMFGPLFPHFPNFNTIRGDKYRDMERYLESLQRIRELAPEVLITGHFAPVVGGDLIRACLDRLEAAVQFVYTETLKGMNAGKDIYTLMEEVCLPSHLYVGQGYGKVSWAVRTVWESYVGWFKARCSSELYSSQPDKAYVELVGMAGMDAVIQRGKKKLVDNDVETALLLAEAALACDHLHGAALLFAIDVHNALLERSGKNNFWEAGWLRYQVSTLQKSLTTLHNKEN